MSLALKIKGPRASRDAALLAAKHFEENYPDRLGVRNGVGYTKMGWKIYLYRTKTQIVAWVSDAQ